MKIALITKDVVPSHGGLERYGAGLAKSLAALGEEVHLFSGRCDEILPPNIQHHAVAATKSFWGIRSDDPIRQAVQASGCDLVYALVPYYPTDMYRAGDGVQAHWMRLKYPWRLTRALAGLMPKRAISLRHERRLYDPCHCRTIVTNSQLVKRHIEEYYQFPSSRIHVVYNGVDHSLFCPGNESDQQLWRQQRQIPDQAMLILFVAHNWPRKGLDTVLHGAAKLLKSHQALVVVIGRGNQRQWQAYAHRLGIADATIRFVPPTSQIVPWYRAADLFVLPTHYDPFANVCLEAMACGLPIITTTENGSGELIKPGTNGYLLSTPFRHDELANHLDHLCDPKLRSDMGREALITAHNFTLERNARETLQVCQACHSR